MTTGLLKTFDFLGSTANEASVDILSHVLREEEGRARDFSLRALVRRDEESAHQAIFDNWTSLTDQQQQQVGERSDQFSLYVYNKLKDHEDEAWFAAAEIAEALCVYDAAPLLIKKAELVADDRVRQRALKVVLLFAQNLGIAARKNIDRPIIRMRLLEQLADSIGRYQFHQRDGLVEAYLCAALWSDASLQALLEDNESSGQLLKVLEYSHQTGVADLLAGWISKRSIPDSVAELLQRRVDPKLTFSLLREIGDTPGPLTLRNLQELGDVDSLDIATIEFESMPQDLQPALLNYLSRNDRYRIESVSLALDLIELGNENVSRVAGGVLRHMEPLNWDELVQEAILMSEIREEDSSDESMRQSIVWRQTQLLNHPDDAIRSTIERSLQAFTTTKLLGYLDTVSVETARKVGVVTRMVDRQASVTLKDELKHPLAERRSRAIDGMVALDLVDEQIEQLREIYGRDNLQVRIKIAESLAWGTSREAGVFLRELSASKSGPIRDAARESIKRYERETAGKGAMA